MGLLIFCVEFLFVFLGKTSWPVIFLSSHVRCWCQVYIGVVKELGTSPRVCVTQMLFPPKCLENSSGKPSGEEVFNFLFIVLPDTGLLRFSLSSLVNFW